MIAAPFIHVFYIGLGECSVMFMGVHPAIVSLLAYSALPTITSWFSPWWHYDNPSDFSWRLDVYSVALDSTDRHLRRKEYAKQQHYPSFHPSW
jgi:hypothetical protein